MVQCQGNISVTALDKTERNMFWSNNILFTGNDQPFYQGRTLQLHLSTRKAARILGVSHPTIIRKLQKYKMFK